MSGQSRVQPGVEARVLTSSQGADLGLQLGKSGQLGEARVEDARIPGQEGVEAGVERVRGVGSGGRWGGRTTARGRGSGGCGSQGQTGSSPLLPHLAGGGGLSGHLRPGPAPHNAVDAEVAHFPARPRRHRQPGGHRASVRGVGGAVGRAPVTRAAQAVRAQPVLAGKSPVLGARGAGRLEVSHVSHQPFPRGHEGSVSLVPHPLKKTVVVWSNLHLDSERRRQR